ncbi:hypothetical protein [Flavobacterium sp. Arc2]|uniref:hypothetical protein n=1 Tax=Flavobacterium sp. Arc2 TaxID=3046685 RepID=UPI00352C41A0
MIKNINYLIDLVGGNSNALSILCLFIGLFVSFYLYFRTFYRLVFSTERICKKRNEITDWKNEQNEYTTRVLFYNNGRKTLTKTEIKQLEINSTNDILSVRLLEDVKSLKLNLKKSRIRIDIEHLDSSNFIVLEIEHKGSINVEGRISETGEILHTEPRFWVVINIIFIIYLFYALFNVLLSLDDKNLNDSSTIVNFLLIVGVFLTVRFIHSLLFIPDSLSAKYLHPKDKWNIEFKNNF